MMKGKCIVHKIFWVLVIVGALNWGLVGAFDFNLVERLLGSWPMVVRVVYGLVGIGAIVMVVGCCCKQCKAACASCGTGEKKM